MHKSTIEIERQIRKSEADHGNHLGDMIVRSVIGASLWMISLLIWAYTENTLLILLFFVAGSAMFFMSRYSLNKAREDSSRIARLYEDRKEMISKINPSYNEH